MKLSIIYFIGLFITGIAAGNIQDIGQFGGLFIIGIGIILYSVFAGIVKIYKS